LFGKVPGRADNLEIVGAYHRRFEEKVWATVWPSSGVIRWADGSIEPETIWTESNLKNCGDYQSKWSRFPRKKAGRFFCPSLFWWQSYYHWICDVLPRFHIFLENRTPDVRIILPQGLTELHRQTLEWLGVPLDECVSHTGRRPWKVEKLLYASPVAMTGDHEAQSLHWMRARMLQGCLGRSEVPPGTRRLYVSRRRAACRRVVNEAEILPVLKHHGFEIIEGEDLGLDEQVRLFSEAAVVVGPHGGGLTNIVWCAPGAKVFEIFEPGSVRRCYWSLCNALGHQHACGIGQAVTESGKEPDMWVESREFAESLEKIVALPRRVASSVG